MFKGVFYITWILMFVLFLYGIPVEYHTIVIGSCPLMQMSCKDCIAFWIHLSHTCTLWVPIFIMLVTITDGIEIFTQNQDSQMLWWQKAI